MHGPRRADKSRRRLFSTPAGSLSSLLRPHPIRSFHVKGQTKTSQLACNQMICALQLFSRCTLYKKRGVSPHPPLRLLCREPQSHTHFIPPPVRSTTIRSHCWSLSGQEHLSCWPYGAVSLRRLLMSVVICIVAWAGPVRGRRRIALINACCGGDTTAWWTGVEHRVGCWAAWVAGVDGSAWDAWGRTAWSERRRGSWLRGLGRGVGVVALLGGGSGLAWEKLWWGVVRHRMGLGLGLGLG